ncbi:universal stress protein [Maribacter halichondriae]|uniref:universal stress protein n=1 Tax=Maribacter halichondriae TaxID=2980554 RepID=UPI00235A391F|nr:universal stress protein [Maribacter sp. Hal144]
MENILVPTDFSNNAYNALFHATRLVKGKACTFHVLNTYNEYTPLRSKSVGKTLIAQLKDESNEGLQRVLHRIKLDEADPKHTFKTISEHGELIAAVSNVVNTEKIDLVVIGNSGRSEIEAIFMGSNALDVIGAIEQCPVLTIPKEVDFKPPKEIAFVTDYQRPYDAGLLQPLLLMAKQYKSKICLMHINEEEVLDRDQEMNRSILLKYLLPFEYTMHWMPLFKNKANSIHTFLNELDIKMLAMVNYEHSFLERITREPVIKRVAFDLDIPFLIIPSFD